MAATSYGPWGGYEQGGVIDNSGGGQDPSYAYALAPGGRFPGDDYFNSEYRAALDNGSAFGDPDYQPGWLLNLLSHGRAGSLIDAHANNVRSPGAGQAPHDSGAAGSNSFFSGPGAAYGPAYGPTRGLVDQGRPPGEAYDGAEHRPEGESTGGTGGKGKGHGGSQAGHFTFSPYQGIQHDAQFVDWQPTAFGEQPNGPTRFVGGGGSSTPRAPAASPTQAPPGGRSGGGAGQGQAGGGSGRGGAGSGHGAGRGGGGGGQGTGSGAGKPGSGGTISRGLPPVGGGQGRPGSLNQTHDSIYGGVDTNYLDFRTPGWLRDPTTGIMNTSGMPNATPFGPQSGFDPNVVGRSPVQGFDSYMTQLHDAGLGNDDIMSLLGPYGYHQNDAGDWMWEWGSGPVVRNPDSGGYEFANGSGSGGLFGEGASAGPGSSGFSVGPSWTGGHYQMETDSAHGPARVAGNMGPGAGSGGGGGQRGLNDLQSSGDFFHGGAFV